MDTPALGPIYWDFGVSNPESRFRDIVDVDVDVSPREALRRAGVDPSWVRVFFSRSNHEGCSPKLESTICSEYCTSTRNVLLLVRNRENTLTP